MRIMFVIRLAEKAEGVMFRGEGEREGWCVRVEDTRAFGLGGGAWMVVRHFAFLSFDSCLVVR
jgi:hypothetical protein